MNGPIVLCTSSTKMPFGPQPFFSKVNLNFVLLDRSPTTETVLDSDLAQQHENI